MPPSKTTPTSTASSSLEELFHASQWWVHHLTNPGKGSPILEREGERITSKLAEEFATRLVSLLETRFHGHWYPKMPQRGQAYRSSALTLHRQARPDPVLVQVLQSVGLPSLYLFDYFPSETQEITMWVDPGEVVVSTLYTFCHDPQETVFWRQEPRVSKDQTPQTQQLLESSPLKAHAVEFTPPPSPPRYNLFAPPIQHSSQSYGLEQNITSHPVYSHATWAPQGVVA